MKNSRVAIIMMIAGVTTGLAYTITSLDSNSIETQPTEWAGSTVLSIDADDWDAEFTKKWCVENNGVWFEPNECKWADRQEHYDAWDNYKLNESAVISGKLANQICDTMDMPCPENVTFKGSQLLKTGEIFYEGTSRGDVYRFKILDEQLSYMRDGIDVDWNNIN